MKILLNIPLLIISFYLSYKLFNLTDLLIKKYVQIEKERSKISAVPHTPWAVPENFGYTVLAVNIVFIIVASFGVYFFANESELLKMSKELAFIITSVFCIMFFNTLYKDYKYETDSHVSILVMIFLPVLFAGVLSILNLIIK